MKNYNQLFSKERIVIDFRTIDNNFAFKIGRINYSCAHPPLSPHVHDGMMELTYIAKGNQVYSVEGNNFTVKSGEVHISYPDEEHSTAGFPEDKSLLYYMIIDLEQLKNGFIGYDDIDGVAVMQDLLNIKRRVFKVHSSLSQAFDSLILDYYNDCPYKRTRLRNQLSDLLIKIIDCEKNVSTDGKFKMQDVISYIEQNIYEDISISMVAEISGLSESRFKDNFRKQVGIPPREYILRKKIEVAKTLIHTTDLSITDIAHKLSFSSSQYFSTVFKRFTFMSPKELYQTNK